MTKLHFSYEYSCNHCGAKVSKGHCGTLVWESLLIPAMQKFFKQHEKCKDVRPLKSRKPRNGKVK